MRSGAVGGRCPHCKAPVPKDHGRSCLECGGSLQKRYLAIGCLSSKPILLFAVGAPLWLAGGDGDAVAGERAESDPRAAVETAPRDAAAAPGESERARGTRLPRTAR